MGTEPPPPAAVVVTVTKVVVARVLVPVTAGVLETLADVVVGVLDPGIHWL